MSWPALPRRGSGRFDHGSMTAAQVSVGAAATCPTTGTILIPADATRHGAAARPQPPSANPRTTHAAHTRYFITISSDTRKQDRLRISPRTADAVKCIRSAALRNNPQVSFTFFPEHSRSRRRIAWVAWPDTPVRRYTGPMPHPVTPDGLVRPVFRVFPRSRSNSRSRSCRDNGHSPGRQDSTNPWLLTGATRHFRTTCFLADPFHPGRIHLLDDIQELRISHPLCSGSQRDISRLTGSRPGHRYLRQKHGLHFSRLTRGKLRTRKFPGMPGLDIQSCSQRHRPSGN